MPDPYNESVYYIYASSPASSGCHPHPKSHRPLVTTVAFSPAFLLCPLYPRVMTGERCLLSCRIQIWETAFKNSGHTDQNIK